MEHVNVPQKQGQTAPVFASGLRSLTGFYSPVIRDFVTKMSIVRSTQHHLIRKAAGPSHTNHKTHSVMSQHMPAFTDVPQLRSYVELVLHALVHKVGEDYVIQIQQLDQQHNI